ncbi:MAG: sensor histidine kinase, partial [Oscillospiraceae bacterium]
AAGGVGSISKKYGRGYIIILFAMLLVFISSILFNGYVTAQYENEMDRLLHFNRLFTNVETTNGLLFDSVTYLRAASIEEYWVSSGEARNTAETVYQDLQQKWTREVADLYYLVQSYLDVSNSVVNRIETYVQLEQTNVDPALLDEYYNAQRTVSYISQNFKNVYSAELVITREMKDKTQILNNLFVFLQGTLVLLAFLVFLFFHRRVIRGVSMSVKQLTGFAQLIVKAPTQQKEISIKTNDELEVFAEAFNDMLRTIQQQMKLIQEDSQIKEQLQQAEMENLRITGALQSSQLKLLQARINPHFLFNTLNIISQTAYIENAEETAQLIEYTANYLRYNLGRVTKVVTVSEEMENVRQYAFIQKKRFGKRINFFFHLEKACKTQELPCMVLQPLVENCIVHGLKNVLYNGEIRVSAYEKGGFVFLEVCDNGMGISNRQRQQLLESFEMSGHDSENHSGLQNVYWRLKQFFNDGLTFAIDSGAQKTRIQIGMPYKGGGKEKG